MGVLDRYRQQATLFQKAPSEIGDVLDLAAIEAKRWKEISNQVAAGGDPTALLGFAGLELTPTVANSSTVTIGSSTEVNFIPTAATPIPANPQTPKLYRLFASGTSVTAATPGTYTLAARLGTTNAGALCGAASGTITPVASASAAQWQLTGWLFVRAGGATAVAVGSFWWVHSNTIGGGGPSTANAVFGGVSATFDNTVTEALYIGCVVTTSTTNSFTPQFVGWGSWS